MNNIYSDKMSEKTLFIELFQPFAQYRNPFTFYYAQSFPLPPKSTIIGMLQNAVEDWYGKKEEYEENGKVRNRWWDLKISAHGGFESIFWNYQNLIKRNIAFTQDGKLINNPIGSLWLPLYGSGLTSQRSPIYQQELFNGHLFIFIKAEKKSSKLLKEIKKSLNEPQKVLYLGRSEDVVFIKKVKFIEPKEKDVSVEGDIKLEYPTYLLRELKENSNSKEFPIKQQKFPVYSIPTRVLFKNNNNFVKHKAEIIKNTERDVEFKSVIYTGVDYTILLKDKVKIERFEIDDKDGKLKFNVINKFGWL